ncbi:MAG: hypothetical protein M3Q07_10015, partial [Pseudobdellovibrionaceae bacterium]|nr:hypothetical protein [Pseudobdellovibrionaceae bacterium]
MRTLSWIGLGLCLAITTVGCSPSRGKTSSLKRAIANDGIRTSLLKVPNLAGGSDLLLKTNNYQTATPTALAYRIACRVPSERNALLTALGFNPLDADALALAYTDPTNPPPAMAQLDWNSHPEIRCPSDRPSPSDDTVDQVVLRRSQVNDKTLFYLQVKSSPVAPKARNLYELGCKGLVEGMGYSLQEAEIIDPQSYIQGSQGRIYDMNCPNGQVADLIPFVAECERAMNMGNSNPRDEAYNELFEHMQGQDFEGSTCTDLWHHLKPKTLLDINGLQISSLEPIRYLTKLRTLNARDNFITDLSPLSNVNNLQELDLGINPDLSDFKPLSSLKSLRQLKVDRTAARDLTALSPLKKLATLDLSHTSVRLPQLDALKSLRIETLTLSGLTLSWREKEQSFFTNCFHLAQLPALERTSMSKVLQAFGATVGTEYQVTPNCFAVYRDVANVEVWPELDLSPYMKFPVGTETPPVTACLLTEILPTLNELPAKIKLDYEGCPLQDKDIVAINKLERLSYLDLRDTGLTDLTVLGSHPNIKNIVLELNGTTVDGTKCPIDSQNAALNTYCMSRRTIAATATKPQHFVSANVQNLRLATFTTALPQ